MGEVYRAKDTRVDRLVALKVLPEEFFESEERKGRFEREARILASLNHPAIAVLYSFEEIPGSPPRHILVMELLEGETLRAALAGAKVSTKRALEWARQIAQGLAAAHEKGIVHRDLKPENVFVTKDGRIKLLDFGLAKATRGEGGGEGTNLPTATRGTEPGVVMGTLGYMSPEQVKGRPADARSDIFSFGAILYEMLSGQRAFHRETAAETISAILKEDVPDLSATNQNVPPGLERLVSHCLEKNPEQRFHSAHDLAFDLESVSGASGTATAGLQAAQGLSRGQRRRLLTAAAVVLLAGVVGAAYVAGRRVERASRRAGASFQQLTYSQQTVFNARFAPDGRSIVYSAAVNGNTPDIFVVRPEFPEAKPLGLRGVHLLSVSTRGEMALLTGARYVAHNVFEGTLARMPLEGGAPRDVLTGVREADWSPDGSSLAVIREIDGKDRLEFPVGKVLSETGGYFSDLRFSPAGDRIAFFEHPVRWDDRGAVAVVDLQGKKTALADGFWGEEGLVWSPDGKQVLFSAGRTSASFEVIAVTLSGGRRTALESAGGLTIRDASPDGRWLAQRDDFFQGMPVLLPGQTAERDLSWLDLSAQPILSVDGKTILFTEFSGNLGANYAVCLRRTDGSPVVRLGEGAAADLSPDGKWALAVVPTVPQQLVLYPTGAGESRRLERGGIESYESARFLPDGRSVLVCGHDPGHAPRCYAQAVGGGPPRAVTPEGTTKGVPSPEGRILVKASGGGLVLYPAGGGEGRPVPGTTADDVAIRWSRDGSSIFVYRGSDVPLRIERIALESGRRETVRTLGPADLSGVISVGDPFLSADEKSYAYDFSRTISHLFLVEGAR